MLLSPSSTPSSASSRPSSAWEQRTLCSGGSGPGQVYYPHGLQVSPDGRSVFVADRSNHRVQHLRLQDPYRGAAIDCTVGGDGATSSSCPCEFRAFCPPRLLPSRSLPHARSIPFSLASSSTVSASAAANTDGLALWRGELFVADAASDQVLVFDAKQLSASPLRSFGGGGELPGQLSQPRGLALWHAGDLGPGPLAVEAGVDDPEEGSLEEPTGAARAQPLLLVAEYHNNRVSVFGSLDGTFRRTLGDVETIGGALPLRHPFDVVHAHGLLIVSEYEDKRLVCFRADAECMPLQVLTPPHCGRLGGLTTDGDWIIAVDASRSRLHYFFVAAPPGSDR